jgi:hypothetical protein
MEAAQVVLVIAVALGAGSIGYGRITRQRLPLLCGMGMIASTCLLVGRYPYPVAAWVLAIWLVVVLAGWVRSRRSRPTAPDAAPPAKTASETASPSESSA